MSHFGLDAGDWLAFAGSLLGAGLSGAGAFWVAMRSIDRAESRARHRAIEFWRGLAAHADGALERQIAIERLVDIPDDKPIEELFDEMLATTELLVELRLYMAAADMTMLPPEAAFSLLQFRRLLGTHADRLAEITTETRLWNLRHRESTPPEIDVEVLEELKAAAYKTCLALARCSPSSMPGTPKWERLRARLTS